MTSRRCLTVVRELGLGSIPRTMISFLLQPLPPPLPFHHINMVRSLHSLQLGVAALILAISAVLTLVFSDKFPAAQPLDFVIVGLMAACALLWNGIIFERVYLQALGIALCLFCLYALVASFLPLAFACACCFFGALCLAPFLYILFRPQPQPA